MPGFRAGIWCVRVTHTLTRSTVREILVRMWHASIQNVKKYSSFERIRGPAFGFVWLRPGETELSNKNKSQINYGPEQEARRFVLTLYALQTRPVSPLEEWSEYKSDQQQTEQSHVDRDYFFIGVTLRRKVSHNIQWWIEFHTSGLIKWVSHVHKSRTIRYKNILFYTQREHKKYNIIKYK